jgi:hypothetical protein
VSRCSLRNALQVTESLAVLPLPLRRRRNEFSDTWYRSSGHGIRSLGIWKKGTVDDWRLLSGFVAMALTSVEILVRAKLLVHSVSLPLHIWLTISTSFRPAAFSAFLSLRKGAAPFRPCLASSARADTLFLLPLQVHRVPCHARRVLLPLTCSSSLFAMSLFCFLWPARCISATEDAETDSSQIEMGNKGF